MGTSPGERGAEHKTGALLLPMLLVTPSLPHETASALGTQRVLDG